LESIAALVVGSFVLTTAVAIFWGAVNSVYDLWMGQNDPGGVTLGAFAAALFTIGLKIALTFVTRWIGRKTGNPAVQALAYDHRNDVIAASGVCVGIVFSRLGYHWVDPVAGALVALVILRTGIHILREASRDLTDAVPGHELHQRLSAIVTGVPGVRAAEEIMAHRFGPYLVLNVIIGVDGTLSVAEGDRIATAVEQTLVRELEMVQRVYVHYHPVRTRA
jgi:cation diffusion facilitator family transporter